MVLLVWAAPRGPTGVGMSWPDGEVFTGRRIRRRELRIEPDDWHALIEADWLGTLVLLERGCVELHCRFGDVLLFREGAVLCFDGTGARALHNPGRITAVLAGYSRVRIGCGDGADAT
ncbi:hypothetical protein ACQEVB_10720 [Pseudonocardia sp. CA-107938]|uniref:hypothetical protein n=1 Tax=Pseudonocardia sp. CA-107938 TaxID=3240021 RepID=UPI003D8A01DC